MTVLPKRDPDAILAARAANPGRRERDLAESLGISEAELVAAQCGSSAVRLDVRVDRLLDGLESVGEVMALTRNETAVHEKIGIYDRIVHGRTTAMVLGEAIDLRIFPQAWTFGFAVEKRDGDAIRRSLQFFDAQGEAVHKVHLRPASNLYAYQSLVESLVAADQARHLAIESPEAAAVASPDAGASVEDLRDRWRRLTDTHQFFGMLKSLRLSRRQAVRMVGSDYAWRLGTDAVAAMMERATRTPLPIMCFVGNRGCIQIHSGPVARIQPMGPWLNVMDETFHLHLRTDRIAEVWGVRKPTKDGHVTSLEAYDAEGELAIQFFGKRKEGQDERREWRMLVETLARAEEVAA